MEAKSRRANGAWGPSDRARAGLGTALDGLGHSDQWGIAVCGPETKRGGKQTSTAERHRDVDPMRHL